MLTDVADTLQSDRCLAGLACWPLIAEQCEPASGLIKLGEKMEGKKRPRQGYKTNNLQCYVYRCLMQLQFEIYRSTEAKCAVAAY